MNNKEKHGEVLTPAWFVNEMYDLLSNNIHNYIDVTKNVNIFEPGCGKGIFYEVFNERELFHKSHYRMNEINGEHFNNLYNLIGGNKQWSSKDNNHKVDILEGDLFKINIDDFEGEIDIVIGNLPFNSNGRKFIPSFSKSGEHIPKSRSNSLTLWTTMTHFCFEKLLNKNGLFFCIIPCIWLKPDRAGIYELFTQIYTIQYLKIFDSYEANKIFNYQCQTPMCYVLVQKKINIHKALEYSRFNIYDNETKQWTNFTLLENNCIPTNHINLFKKHVEYFTRWCNNTNNMGHYVKKISCMRKEMLDHKIKIYEKGGLEGDDAKLVVGNKTLKCYKIITGSIFDKKTNKLTLNGFTCENPGLYQEYIKLILPHKRLAKFIKDSNYDYGLSGRDMFVFFCKTKEDLDKLYDFVNLPHIQKMIESGFCIRMNFIEKYVFSYFPWILEEYFDITHYMNYIIQDE